MSHWFDLLSDADTRTSLGRRFEAVTDEVFGLVRWALILGFARYLSWQAPSVWFDLIYWALALMLFASLASRFLLRPEIPVFADRSRRWKRVLQTLVNYVVCMAAFMVVLRGINQLVNAVADYRLGALTY